MTRIREEEVVYTKMMMIMSYGIKILSMFYILYCVKLRRLSNINFTSKAAYFFVLQLIRLVK